MINTHKELYDLTTPVNVATDIIMNILTDTFVKPVSITDTGESFIREALWTKVTDLTRLHGREHTPLVELSGYWYGIPTTSAEENDLIDYLGFVDTLEDDKTWTDNIKAVLAVAHDTGDLYIEDFQEFEDYRDML